MKTRRQDLRRQVALAVVLIVVGAALIIFTIELATDSRFQFLAANRDRIVAAEIALLGILAIELVGRAIRQYFRRRDALHLGFAVRNALRAAGYGVLGVTVISLLSANPAVALGVGGVTGIIVAFAVQNIVGNMLAGTFLALGPLFRVGDWITVAGVSGQVVEIGLVHTLIDAGDRWVFVPSGMLLTNAVQRVKVGGAEESAQASGGSESGKPTEKPGASGPPRKDEPW